MGDGGANAKTITFDIPCVNIFMPFDSSLILPVMLTKVRFFQTKKKLTILANIVHQTKS
ncbi:MAG: hypothetical protein ACRD38_13165 [Nitrososphaerales archaeon]